jgi:hypothetical protein
MSRCFPVDRSIRTAPTGCIRKSRNEAAFKGPRSGCLILAQIRDTLIDFTSARSPRVRPNLFVHVRTRCHEIDLVGSGGCDDETNSPFWAPSGRGCKTLEAASERGICFRLQRCCALIWHRAANDGQAIQCSGGTEPSDHSGRGFLVGLGRRREWSPRGHRHRQWPLAGVGGENLQCCAGRWKQKWTARCNDGEFLSTHPPVWLRWHPPTTASPAAR